MSTTQTYKMYEITEAHGEGRVSLRPNAACTHETGEDMYDSYGWHTSSEIFGDCTLQIVEYGWLDDGLADPVERTILALGWPDSSKSGREIRSERRALAESLVDRARSVREDMDGIESLLDDAVTAYESADLDAVIEALQNASSTENDHGDDPATSELIHDLLQIE